MYNHIYNEMNRESPLWGRKGPDRPSVIQRILNYAGTYRIQQPIRAMWRKAFIVILSSAAATLCAPAQTFTTIVNFNGTGGAGGESLLQGADGNFYGTTGTGGTGSSCTSGCGTIFKITAAGALTTLHDFNGTDGSSPIGLMQAADGNFYGTTGAGGTSKSCASGCGTIFKITPAGALTTLHSFEYTDGSSPSTPFIGLVQATDGNFYGAAGAGGAGASCTSGCGTIFKITPAGVLTTLHTFNGADGSGPTVLLQASDGNFYGSSGAGGAYGHGTIFKLTPAGALTTLYTFNETDGYNPTALVQGADGNFYGIGGGGTFGDGTVFKITPAYELTTLAEFNGTDGSSPSWLMQASDGNFYGINGAGGAYGEGTIFKITPDGTLTTLLYFEGANGEKPVGLVQATDGSFYGTTSAGGANGHGTVFGLSVGLGPVPSINPGGLVNAANYAAPVAPGSIASVFGDFLLAAPLSATESPLPPSISGLSLEFGGVTAPLFFASSGQANVQVPWESAGQSQTTLTASLNGQASTGKVVGLAAYAPAIFSTNAAGSGQGAITDTSYRLVDSTNPATAGSTVVLIYCTGLGAVTNQPPTGSPAPSDPLAHATTPTVTIGGVSASVGFSGLAPGYVGLYQVNAQVPAGSATGPAVPVVISIGGVESNTVTMAVQ
jgi:uncharacterized protein (TIGR03437 family)